MKLNTVVKSKRTHEGAKAKHVNAEQKLRRSVMACLLWENTFYESGEDIGSRIISLCHKVSIEKLSAIAIEARSILNLRHAPLLLIREMARHSDIKKNPSVVSYTIAEVIQRPDELAEFLAIYWKDGRQPLSAQVKKGLARAFEKFNAYQLAKYYNREGAVKIKDALFLSHAKPSSQAREELYKMLIAGTLPSPETWENKLSRGDDKKTSWEELLIEKELGALAFLRNLRNMDQVGVSKDLIRQYAKNLNTERVLPFRFIAAARSVPHLESMLEEIMLKQEHEKLDGETVLVVDVSGSMNQALSAKSDMRRIDAACGLAILLREMTDNLRVFTFSDKLVEVPARRGFALRDSIDQSQAHNGTYLGKSVSSILSKFPNSRLIVISDEQSADAVPDPDHSRAYMLNVASYENGVGYGAWKHIDGFSESVVRWIQEFEN